MLLQQLGPLGILAIFAVAGFGLGAVSNPVRALTVLMVIRTLSDWAPLGLGVNYLLNEFIIAGAILAAVLSARQIPGAMLRWERAYVVFLMLGFVVGLVSPHFGIQTVSALLRPLSYFAMAHVALMVVRTRGLQETFAALTRASIPAAFTVLSGLAHFPGMSSGARPRGTFSHPNVAGAYLALAGLLALYLLLEEPTWRRAWVALLFPAAMLTTFSADASLTYVFGVGVTILLMSKRSLATRTLIVVVILLAAGAIAPFIGITGKLSHAFATVDPSVIARGNQNSLQWRFNNWHLLIQLWEQRPWFGYGLGSTDSFLQPLHAPPHSEYVRALAEGGIVGAALFVFLIIALVRYAFRRGPGMFSVGGRVIVAALVVNAIAANTIVYTPVMFFFAAVVGASVAGSAEADPLGRGKRVGRPPLLHRDPPYRTLTATSSMPARTR